MSKIEKALNRARGERGNWPVLVPVADAGEKPSTGTALVADRVGHAVSTENIGRMAASERRLLRAGDLSQRGIIYREQVEDPAVQAFREVRTKIIQQSQGRNGVILVTAVSKGSGSSFVAQNLGAAFAFDTAKTSLLIDCNLKNPSLHRLLANDSAPGLTDYLENPDMDIAEIIHPVGIARVRVIAAGARREIPAEYFTSLKIRHLIDSVRQRYSERFIILDGPPTSDIADVRILSELCDFSIVIARYGRVTNTQIENRLKAIDKKKLLGIVFNDEPRVPLFR
jgi:capsular exopolysaccharide synthesis family protein